MRVDVLLEDDAGQLLRRVWTLAADGGDGLYVPTLPALAALKMLAAGTLEWRGAGPCAGFIPYDAIAAEFGHHNIKTQTQEISAPAPLFRRLLGDAYDALPPAIRQAHEVHGVLVLEGKADAASPDHVLGTLIAWLFRLPRSGSDMPVRVEMRSEDDGSETWTRIYPGVTMRSNLRNADSATHQVDEVLGPLSIRLQWKPSERGLQLETIRRSHVRMSATGLFAPALACQRDRRRGWPIPFRCADCVAADRHHRSLQGQSETGRDVPAAVRDFESPTLSS